MLTAINETPTMSSIDIAKLTGKRHADVLDSIRKILNEVDIDSTKFSAQYKDTTGRLLPCFNLPRRECDLVIAGYSAKYRLAIIDRWRELEAATPKLPTTYLEALKALVEVTEQNEEQARQLQEFAIKQKEDEPKIEFAMAVRNMDGTCSIGDFAKAIKIGRNTFFSLLRCDGYLMENNMPYARHKRYFAVSENKPYTDSDGKTHPSFTTRITGVGQVYLEKKYRVIK